MSYIRTFFFKVLRNGEGVSTRPSTQCQVRMRVRGVLVPPPRRVVDRHNSLSFTVGDGDVIQGNSFINEGIYVIKIIPMIDNYFFLVTQLTFC